MDSIMDNSRSEWIESKLSRISKFATFEDFVNYDEENQLSPLKLIDLNVLALATNGKLHWEIELYIAQCEEYQMRTLANFVAMKKTILVETLESQDFYIAEAEKAKQRKVALQNMLGNE